MRISVRDSIFKLVPFVLLTVSSAWTVECGIGSAFEAKTKELLPRLPADWALRLSLEKGERGDGKLQPWMEEMRADYMKRIKTDLFYVWDNNTLTLEIAGMEFFDDYGDSQPPAQLKPDAFWNPPDKMEIVEFGVTTSARAAYLPRFQELQAKNHIRRFSGHLTQVIYDDPCFPLAPGVIATTDLNDAAFHPLLKYAALGDVDAVKALLQAGTDVNQTDLSDNTALISAIGKKTSLAMVQTLVEAGANVNAIIQHGSVLDRANLYKKPEIIDYLKQHGARTYQELRTSH